jgi:hypothetical protein
MKAIPLLFACFLTTFCLAQKPAPLPHGVVFGTKPSTVAMLNATALEASMGKKTRISTTIKGKVIRVTKTKGGWFDIDAGNGKIIAAHFSNYGINIPFTLKGRYIIAEGIAQKQFIADDMQHLAGDTVSGKKQHEVKTNPKQKVTFEVKGLMVE